jgi:succinyl-CoA synthetase alpha subunit
MVQARHSERRRSDQSLRRHGFEHRLLSRASRRAISSIAHIGGDAVLGIRIPDAALMFEADPLTEAIVIFRRNRFVTGGGIGAADRDRKVTKPVIAYIGGKAAREGTRFSHAGAIIEGGRGTHAGKVKALREAARPWSMRLANCRVRS